MYAQNDRAFKEWAVVCAALGSGLQTVLLRKGGIREEGGQFTVETPEFFLLPTYEHQNEDLLKPEHVADLNRILAEQPDPRTITLSHYATVAAVDTAADQDRVRSLTDHHVWNDVYVRQRFDFNPYDPLYVMLLRVYVLPAPVRLDMRPEYAGCRSWVTLDRSVSTAGAKPVLSDEEFLARKGAVLAKLQS